MSLEHGFSERPGPPPYFRVLDILKIKMNKYQKKVTHCGVISIFAKNNLVLLK